MLRNLALLVTSEQAPTRLPDQLTAQWPVPFLSTSLTSNSTGQLQLSNVTVQVSQCSNLLAYQQLVCGIAAADPTGTQLWGLPQVRARTPRTQSNLAGSRDFELQLREVEMMAHLARGPTLLRLAGMYAPVAAGAVGVGVLPSNTA